MTAELVVRRPGSAIVPFKRQRIDKDRLRPAELDVEGRGILQTHSVFQRALLDLQRQKRGIAKLAERPLVGIRDMWNLFGNQNASQVTARRRSLFRMGYQQSVLHKTVVQAGRDQLFIITNAVRRYGSLPQSLLLKYVAGRV